VVDIAVAQLDDEAVPGDEVGAAFGPLDDEDAALRIVPKPEVVELFDVLHAIEVDVVESLPAVVLIHEDEGGTVDRPGAAEAPANALREAGLAGAEVAAEEEDIALAQGLSETLADVASLLLVAGR
jgi:hypothetical protein